MYLLKSKRFYFALVQLMCIYGILMLFLKFKSDKVSEKTLNRNHIPRSNDISNKHQEISPQQTLRKMKDKVQIIDKIQLNESSDINSLIESLKRRVLQPNQPSVHTKPIQNDIPPDKVATVNYNNTVLLEKLGNNWQWNFTTKRTRANWNALVQDTKYAIERGFVPEKSTKRRVLVAPGVLEITSFAKLFSQGKVGPLGELVQWSDLIAGLYILGHDVELQYNMRNADQILQTQLKSQPSGSSTSGCGTSGNDFDYIYTDLSGHSTLSQSVQKAYKQKFRILDLFGTEQAYNNIYYAQKHRTFLSAGSWGQRNLHLKQLYTIYPQTPDNTFLGCMIFKPTTVSTENRHIAYLYGKEPHLLKGLAEPSQIIPLLQKYTEVHSSFIEMPYELKSYKLVNHGHLNPKEYAELAEKTKVLVGLGKPVEGPGFLEAMARGCVIINPANPPNFKYSGKPTSRIFTSQHPYAEKFIGPPYVFTVDYSNTKLLEEVVKIALNTQVKPFIPFELTPGGFLQRLYTLLEHQNWCTVNKTMWPPLSSMKVILGDKSRSCNEVCEEEGLVCENLHFPVINNKTIFTSQKLDCKTEVSRDELYAPSYIPETSTCVFQKDPDLYSCASYEDPKTEIHRLCPCRDFIRHQVHMCRNC